MKNDIIPPKNFSKFFYSVKLLIQYVWNYIIFLHQISANVAMVISDRQLVQHHWYYITVGSFGPSLSTALACGPSPNGNLHLKRPGLQREQTLSNGSRIMLRLNSRGVNLRANNSGGYINDIKRLSLCVNSLK